MPLFAPHRTGGIAPLNHRLLSGRWHEGGDFPAPVSSQETQLGRGEISEIWENGC